MTGSVGLAEPGDAGAEAGIGVLPHNGLSVARDDLAAATWVVKAAEQDHIEPRLFLPGCWFLATACRAAMSRDMRGARSLRQSASPRRKSAGTRPRGLLNTGRETTQSSGLDCRTRVIRGDAYGDTSGATTSIVGCVRRHRLWRSADAGASWVRVASIPTDGKSPASSSKVLAISLWLDPPNRPRQLRSDIRCLRWPPGSCHATITT
jgi:hypothetical protein